MDQGGWFANVSGPSPELEALWGPNAEPPRPRRRIALIAGAAAVAVVVVGVGAFLLTRDGGGDHTVTTASATTVPTVSEEQAANAEAFLERWNAGPSTTMPLGEAGVPPEERPTTTTAVTIPRSQSTIPRTQSTISRAPRTTAEPAPSWSRQQPSEPVLAADDPRLAGAEHAARAFVDAMMRRDCDAVWSMLSTPTLEFFAAMEEDAPDGESFRESFCSSLREEQIPEITVRGPARPWGDGAQVTIEAEGEVEQLPMLLEGDRWTVDLLGASGSEGEGDEPAA